MHTYTDLEPLLAAYSKAAREGYEALPEPALSEAPAWGWAEQPRDRGYFRLRLQQPPEGLQAEQLQWLGDIADRITRGRVFLTATQCVELTDIHYQHLPEVLQGAQEQSLERCSLTASVAPLVTSPFGAHDTQQQVDAHNLIRTWHSVWSHKTVQLPHPIQAVVSTAPRGLELPQLRDFAIVAASREGHPESIGFDVWVGGGFGVTALPLGLWITEESVVEVVHGILELWRRYTQSDPELAQASLQSMVLNSGREAIVQGLEKILERLLDRSVIPQVDSALAEDPIGVFALKEDFRFGVGIPLTSGRITAAQLKRVADVCKRYADPVEVRITPRQGLMLLNLPEGGLENILSGLQKDGLRVSTHPVQRGFLSSPTAMPGPQAVEIRARAEQLAEHLEKRVHWEGSLIVHMASDPESSAAVRHADIGLAGTHVEAEGRPTEAFEVWVGAVDTNGRRGLRLHEGIPAYDCAKRLEQLLQASKVKSKKDEPFLDWVQRWGVERVQSVMMADPEHPLADAEVAAVSAESALETL